MQNRSWLMAAAFLLAAPFIGLAQDAVSPAPSAAEAESEEIIVSATRLPIPEDESPASITVITRARHGDQTNRVAWRMRCARFRDCRLRKRERRDNSRRCSRADWEAIKPKSCSMAFRSTRVSPACSTSRISPRTTSTGSRSCVGRRAPCMGPVLSREWCIFLPSVGAGRRPDNSRRGRFVCHVPRDVHKRRRDRAV